MNHSDDEIYTIIWNVSLWYKHFYYLHKVKSYINIFAILRAHKVIFYVSHNLPVWKMFRSSTTFANKQCKDTIALHLISILKCTNLLERKGEFLCQNRNCSSKQNQKKQIISFLAIQRIIFLQDLQIKTISIWSRMIASRVSRRRRFSLVKNLMN